MRLPNPILQAFADAVDTDAVDRLTDEQVDQVEAILDKLDPVVDDEPAGDPLQGADPDSDHDRDR